MNDMSEPRKVRIEYIRPGKDVQEFTEDLLIENERYIRTYSAFRSEVVQDLTQGLRKLGFIAPDQTVASVTKTYFFHEHFDLLLFQNQEGEVLGYYSDVGTPLIQTATGYQMTDWFLDIWLSPDGTLFELDVDEFEEARSKNLMRDEEAGIARKTFARLIEEVKQGTYPHAYLK